MSWVAVGGAVVGGLAGAGADSDANAETNANYVDAQNSANNNYATAMNRSREGTANTTNEWAKSQWQADNAQKVFEGQAQQSMFGTKYGIAQNQANYDALQGEFGDMADNVASHFKSLSASSKKAQNNDAANAAYSYELSNLNQSLSEQGINPGSGMSAALKAQAAMTNATSKVMMNRNVESEIAQQQSNFMSSAVTNPLYQARPEDFSAGMLTQGELGAFAPENTNQLTDQTVASWDPMQANVAKGEKQSGGWVSGAVSGALGAIF